MPLRDDKQNGQRTRLVAFNVSFYGYSLMQQRNALGNKVFLFKTLRAIELRD